MAEPTGFGPECSRCGSPRLYWPVTDCLRPGLDHTLDPAHSPPTTTFLDYTAGSVVAAILADLATRPGFGPVLDGLRPEERADLAAALAGAARRAMGGG